MRWGDDRHKGRGTRRRLQPPPFWAALPGRYADGDGLYLPVRDRGTPFRLNRYTLAGRRPLFGMLFSEFDRAMVQS
jgi:hypothetical protein